MASSVTRPFRSPPNVMGGTPWKLKATIILLLVVFAYVTVSTMAAKSADRKRVNETRSCQILVVLSNPGPKRCLNVLALLGETAVHPDHVRVLVVERPEPRSAAKYLRKHKHTRLRVDTQLSLGGGAEHRRLGLEALENEHYVLFICSDAVPSKGWDHSAVQQLQECEELCSPGETPILTGALTSSTHASFLALDDGEDGCIVPSVVPVMRLGACGSVLQSPVWSSVFSFAVAELWRRHQPYVASDTDAAGSAEDVLISARLWGGGVRFFVPGDTNILSRRTGQKQNNHPPAPAVVRSFATGQYSRYEQFAGIMCAKAWVSPRARMGIANEADPSEWLAKYGSRQEVTRVFGMLTTSELPV